METKYVGKDEEQLARFDYKKGKTQKRIAKIAKVLIARGVGLRLPEMPKMVDGEMVMPEPVVPSTDEEFLAIVGNYLETVLDGLLSEAVHQESMETAMLATKTTLDKDY